MRYTLSGLSPSTAYAVQVRSKNSQAESEWSRRFLFTTSGDTTAPDVPTGLSCVVNGDTFVITFTGINGTLDQNLDLNHYDLDLYDGISHVIVPLSKTEQKYVLSYEQNRVFFGTPKATITAKVRSVDNIGNTSAYTATQADTNPAPASVSGLSATSLYDSIALSWTANTDLDLAGYRVDVSTTGVAGSYTTVYSGRDNTFDYPTTAFATDHYFKVYALDKFNSASTATTSSAVRPKSTFSVDTTAPNVPGSLTAAITNNVNGIGARAAITWTMVAPPSDLQGYTVRYRKVGDTNWAMQPFSADVLAGTVELGSAYTNYEFQIRAYDWMNNNSAWSATTTATSPSNTAPATVAGVTMTAGRDSATVSWTENTESDVANGAGLYEVTFSTSSTFASGNTIYRTGAPSITISALTPATPYYARVKAIDSQGLASVAFSTTATATTGTFPSTSLSDGSVPTSSPVPTLTGAEGMLLASWTPIVNTDLTTYEVYLGTVSTFTANAGSKVGESMGTNLQILKDGAGAALVYGTTYFAKTIAKDRDGAAAVSAASTSATMVKLASTGIAATARQLGSTIVTTSATAPSSPLVDDLWNDTVSGLVKKWSGSAWVDTGIGTQSYVQSRGMNLVTNGSAGLKTNYNFTDFTYYGADSPGGGGSFRASPGVAFAKQIDEFIPVNPSLNYRLSFAGKNLGTTGFMYCGLQEYDIDRLTVTGYQSYYVANTLTTLAADLVSGSNTVQLTSSTNWDNSATTSRHYVQFWNYVDGTGKAWAPLTYTRNTTTTAQTWAAGGISGNTITLAATYTGPTVPAGTQVSNGVTSGTYKYMTGVQNIAEPLTWTTYSSNFGGVITDGINGGANSLKFFQGTAFVQPVWLGNRLSGVGTSDPASDLLIGNVYMSEITASNLPEIANAQATADGKNTVTYAAAAPGATANKAGDTWWVRATPTSVITAQYEGAGGTTWNAKTLDNAVIANLDAGKITTGFISAGRINTNTITAAMMVTGTITAASGVIASLGADKLVAGTITGQTITLATTGIIQSADYVAGTTGFKLNSGGLEIRNGIVNANTIVSGTGILNNLVINSPGAIQSSNYVANTTGFKIDNSFIDIGSNGFINAGALKAGTVTATTINIGATGTLNVDSTGQIKSNNYSLNVSGYKLSNAGLEINDGSIDAKVMKTSSLTAATITLGSTGIIQSSDYPGGTAGFKLDSAGLVIRTGTISAAALTIQTGENIIPPMFADFEGNPTAYTGNIIPAVGSFTIDTTDFKFNTQSLKWTLTTGTSLLDFGTSTTDYNFIVNPTATYIISYYAMIKTGATAISIQPVMRYATATTPGTIAGTSQALPANSTWARYTTTVVVPGTATGGGHLYFTSTGVSTVYIDGIQIEEKIAGSNVASTWTPPGLTRIDGGLIRTGEIRSVTDTTLNGVTLPTWSINTSGAAVFSNALIRGNTIVGSGTAEGTASYIKSYNYVQNVSGWSIDSAGNAEFRQLASNSINSESIKALSGNKLTPGTVSADLILTSNITSGDSAQFIVTNKVLASNVATLTTATAHGRLAGDRVVVTGVGTPFDTPLGTRDVVTSVTSNTFSFARVAANVTTTVVSSPSAIVMFYGRSVNVSPSGITLMDQAGVTLIKLPTNPLESPTFTGTINTNGFTSSDLMTIFGVNNYMGLGSKLTLAAGATAPSAGPVYSPSWNTQTTWFSDGGFSNGKYGYYIDGTALTATTANCFYGGQAFVYNAFGGGFINNFDMAGTNASIEPRGGLTKLGTDYYVLMYDTVQHDWFVYRYPAGGTTPFSTTPTIWNYGGTGVRADLGATTATQCRLTSDGGSIPDPCIGNDGTNILIARCHLTDGQVRITPFTTTGTKGTSIVTDIFVGVNLRSVNYGTFDFGATRYVVTTAGSASNQSENYVYNASGASQPLEWWTSANGGTAVSGTAWSNAWSSLATSGKQYDYTSMALGVGNNWSAKCTLVSNDTTTASIINKQLTANVATLGTSGHPFVAGDTVTVAGVDATFNGTYVISSVATNTFSYSKVNANIAFAGATGTTVRSLYETPLSVSQGFSVVPRAKMTLTGPIIPGTGQHNEPNCVRFYVANTEGDGLFHRQTDTAIGSNSATYTTTPNFTTATTPDLQFAASTPSKISSSNGKLELNSDGYALFGATDDVNATSGNKPALRVGDVTGKHLRIDGNEIMAMASDNLIGTAVQGELFLNIGAKTSMSEKTWQKGYEDITPTAANTITTRAVTFPVAFGNVPIVMLQIMTGLTAAGSNMAYTNSISTTGFNLQILRANTTTTRVRWFALDIGQIEP